MTIIKKKIILLQIEDTSDWSWRRKTYSIKDVGIIPKNMNVLSKGKLIILENEFYQTKEKIRGKFIRSKFMQRLSLQNGKLNFTFSLANKLPSGATGIVYKNIVADCSGTERILAYLNDKQNQLDKPNDDFGISDKEVIPASSGTGFLYLIMVNWSQIIM